MGKSFKYSYSALRFCKNIAAGVSLMIRRLKERLKYILEWASMRPGMTTGLVATRPTPRMSHCG